MQCVQGLTTYSADIIGGIIRRKNKELCVCVWVTLCLEEQLIVYIYVVEFWAVIVVIDII